MPVHSHTRSVVAVTTVVISLMSASLVGAQATSTPPQPVVIPATPVSPAAATGTVSRLEIDGAITAINGAQILVGGIQFDISRAQISRPLSIGLFVHVEAVLTNGVWLATEVNAERLNTVPTPIVAGTLIPAPNQMTPAPAATLLPSVVGQEVELYGVITLIEPGFITVGGQRIDIRRAELNLPSMGIGTIVKLHVSGAPGSYIAREVELIEGDDLNQAEMAAVLAGGLIVDFDRRDDRRGGSSNSSNNTSSNSSSNTSSNSSSNTSSNSSSNTSSNSSSNSSSDDSSGRSSNSSSGSSNSGRGSDDSHQDDRNDDRDDENDDGDND